MPDPIKKKKVNTKPKTSALVQVPAGKGASRYVKADSAAGKKIAKAKAAATRKKSGKKLLRSEQLALSKSFNTTKPRKKVKK